MFSPVGMPICSQPITDPLFRWRPATLDTGDMANLLTVLVGADCWAVGGENEVWINSFQFRNADGRYIFNTNHEDYITNEQRDHEIHLRELISEHPLDFLSGNKQIWCIMFGTPRSWKMTAKHNDDGTWTTSYAKM